MTETGAKDHIELLCTWLHDELGEQINVYPSGDAAPCSTATLAHLFSVSVRSSGVADLLLLRNVREREIHASPALTIVQIDAIGPVQSRGDLARREFVIHVREQR